jgi:exosortase A-associated hydrolase 2
VHAARAFAEAGVGVLRFDYRGCGDSGGEFAQATVAGWMEDIGAAVAALRSHVGSGPLGLLGLRFGAALAARAAEQMPEVARLVLWEPVIDGRSYFAADLRKKLIKEMMTRGKAAGSRSRLLEELERGQGRIDFDGYEITGALYSGLTEMNLPRQVRNFRGQCLLCQVSFTDKLGAHVSALMERYTQSGAAPSLATVVEEPFWSKVDFAGCPGLIETTLKWLRQGPE